MAEKNDNWFDSWINAAKNKSSEVLEFVKKDLEEFGNAVKNEASSVVTNTGIVIEKTLKLDSPESTASSMKRSFSSFLGQMNNVLNPSPDDSDTEAILIVEGSETVKLTKLQQAVYELQKNEKTFLDDPDVSLNKQYQCWLEIVDDQLTEDRLNKHLNSSITLNNQYKKLVPESVSPQLFWKRYLFKKALLEDDLARQEALEKREQKEKEMTAENLKWDQEDFANDIELTEEEQIKLLEQYENETKLKNQPNSGKRIPKELIGEKVLFKKNLPTKIKTTPIDKKINNDIDNIVSDAVIVEKVDNLSCKDTELVVKIVDSSVSLESGSSNSSTDGEWEKVSVVDK